MEFIEERKFSVVTNKNNKLEFLLRNYNNKELSFTFFNLNEIQYKKYELIYNLEEFQKIRFFKIFINIDEIMKELETKIMKSKFIEDTNCIIMEIEIGLTVINEIILVVEEVEKNKDEIINELNQKIRILENKINERENKLKDAENRIKLNEFKLKDAENKMKLFENKMKLQLEQINELKKKLELNSKKNISYDKINEDDFEKIYKDLNEEYNIEKMGKNRDFIKKSINEILQNLNKKFNNKNELIDFIKEKLLEYIFE
jgi:hypothetical protein